MSKGKKGVRQGVRGDSIFPQINDLNRILSINFCFFIDPVTNGDVVLNDAIFSVMMLPFSSEYIIFFSPTVFNFLIQSLHGVLLA
jgi:hypothetical protein